MDCTQVWYKLIAVFSTIETHFAADILIVFIYSCSHQPSSDWLLILDENAPSSRWDVDPGMATERKARTAGGRFEQSKPQQGRRR